MSESNKKVAVIYRTKYGSTKRYAQWIAEEVKGDLYEGSKVGIKDLLKYDIIVFGGSLHAVGIIGIDLIKNNFKRLKDKKLIVFAVGASPVRKEAVNHVINSNFTYEMKAKINFFMLRGAFNFKKLNLIDKFLMNLLRLKLKRKKEEELDDDSRGLLASYDNPVDWTDKKAIKPIVDCIRE